MKRIMIKMSSGTGMEKPLVTAFKSNGGEYIVLDNEMNGTMGLPIILVSKLENNVLKIIPDTEWNAVKECLRLIISGNHTDYINVSDNIMAEDNFFKQLTLPVASFEALKGNYAPVEEVVMPNNNIGINNINQQNEVLGQNVMNNNFGPTPVMPQVTPEPVAPVAQVTPQVNVSPVMPSAPMENQTMSMVEPVSSPLNNVTPVEPVEENVPVDFTADKEAFLKACENMFDALVAKFNNK